MQDSSQKVAIVTGAARGIGFGVAESLLARDYAVALLDCDAEAGVQAGQQLARAGRVEFLQADVADEADVERALDETLAHFGRLDALVNNAGIADPACGAIEALEREHWDRYLAVHLTGSLLMAKHGVPALRRQRGNIVNIASTRAYQSEPDTYAYSAAKGGIVALTHAMAVSLGPEIRVNCICPGWIDTRPAEQRDAEPLSATDHAQHPAGRAGLPTDVGELAAWLLSNAAGFVTGQSWCMDGGMSRKMIYAD